METATQGFPELALDSGAGPARPLAAAQAAALIDAALAGAGFGPPPPVAKLRPRLRPRVWVATGVVVAAGAAAAIWYATRSHHETPAAPPTPPVPQQLAPPPQQAAPPQPVLAPAQDAEPDIQIEPPPATPTTPPAITPHAVRPAPHLAPEPAAPETVDQLMARANALRGERKWKDADELYDRVAAKFPGTLSAHVADVASGELALEHLGSPARARKRFEAALAAKPKGPLAEEARYGIAEAFRAAGDTANEAAALRAFLLAHPRSERRAEAQARLRSLSLPH